MVERESAIEYIRRMIALAESNPNEHEAQLAMQKATEWMTRYNIGLVEVQESEVTQGADWTTEIAWQGPGIQWDQSFIHPIIEKFFFVQVFTDTLSFKRTSDGRVIPKERSVKFFGDKPNVEVARYVYVFLRRTFRNLWDDYRKKHNLSLADSRTYYLGLQRGFIEKMRETRERFKSDVKSANALIVLEDRAKEALKEHHPGLIFIKSAPVYGSQQTLEDGKKHGKEINLRDGLRHQSNQGRLR